MSESPTAKIDLASARKQLVATLERMHVIQTPRIAAAFSAVPREAFFPASNQSSAYDDSAHPIGSGQTISQPTTIAHMLEMLQVQQGNRTLEIGCGSGYVLALLSQLTAPKHVFGVELRKELVKHAHENLKRAGVSDVSIHAGDGCQGLQTHAPFDRILISAATAFIPPALKHQLSEGGTLVAPVGQSELQALIAYQKRDGQLVETKRLDGFLFVPLQCQ